MEARDVADHHMLCPEAKRPAQRFAGSGIKAERIKVEAVRNDAMHLLVTRSPLISCWCAPAVSEL